MIGKLDYVLRVYELLRRAGDSPTDDILFALNDLLEKVGVLMDKQRKIRPDKRGIRFVTVLDAQNDSVLLHNGLAEHQSARRYRVDSQLQPNTDCLIIYQGLSAVQTKRCTTDAQGHLFFSVESRL